MKRIVYTVGGLLSPNGMSSILSAKINYLAKNTDYELFMILTERPEQAWYYKIDSKVRWVNFNINFDELDTMPILKKIYFYIKKQKRYKKLFTNFLMNIQPDITVSTLRREINFINDIPDSSIKIGEIHFDRLSYRKFRSPYLPMFINKFITKIWINNLICKINQLDQFVVLTQEDYNNWPEIKKKIVIPNFIPIYNGEPSDLSIKNAIAVGRYTWQKGFDLLIEAWDQVARCHPDWTLNIYGSGDSKSYHDMIFAKGLSDKIFCHTASTNIFETLKTGSLFVFSSRFEGFGIVLIEAMSVGLPTISFACPCGPKDIISHNSDGLLIRNGDINSLAKGICHLIEQPELRIKMGKNAQKKALLFSADNIMKKWILLFDNLMLIKE